MGEYGLHNTPAGIKQIIDAAVKVCPALADLAIERTWAGLRPVTPDTFPVLGASARCPNLFVAGGYWRNGVLLAPKTAQLVADAVCGCVSPEDEVFLRNFSMDRFTIPGTPAAAARNSARPSRPAAAAPPQSPKGASVGMGAETYISEASPSEILEMERAALEGANDGDMLSALEGMFGKGMVKVEVCTSIGLGWFVYRGMHYAVFGSIERLGRLGPTREHGSSGRQDDMDVQFARNIC